MDSSRTLAVLLRAALFLTAVLSSNCQTTPLTISVSQITRGLNRTVTLEFDSTMERNIHLAPGLNYTFTCMRTGGFGVNNGVWYRNGVAISLDASERIFAINGNTWRLLINSFIASDGGRYSCQNMGDTLDMVVSSANPAIIPAALFLTLNSGFQNNNRPSLRTLVSGMPLPTTQQEMWLYNNGTVLPFGTLTPPGELLLESTIDLRQNGTYTLVVTTTAGTARAEFQVLVIVLPSVSISPAMALTALFGTSVNITCSDGSGHPRPTFSWRFDGQPLLSGGNVTIMDVPDPAQQVSRLQLSSVSLASIGVYQCVASNNPTDRTVYSGQEINVTVLDLPLPPASISAMPASPCTVSIVWTTSAPNGTVDADLFVFEVQFVVGATTEQWVELGRGSSSPLQLPVPFRGVNTTYSVRGRGYNGTTEPECGPPSTPSQTLVGYQVTSFPVIENVLGRPAGPNSINVSWSFSATSCYMYTNFTVSCEQELGGNGSSPVVTSTGGGVTLERVVVGLVSDTIYNCRVHGRFTASQGGGRITEEQVSPAVRTFTFPQSPQTPVKPEFDPTSITNDRFTVNLEPLQSNQNISHYQIVVVRLAGPDNSLPTSHPDTNYPDNSTFSTCLAINNQDNKKDAYPPYVAAEFATGDFMPKFVVGGGGMPDSGAEDRCNDKLLSGVGYTVFLRAFPQSFFNRQEFLGSGGTIQKRQAVQGSHRQYIVFSSSDFLPAISTEVTSPSKGPVSGPSPTEIVIIIVCVIVVTVFLLIILAVVIIALCFYRRTRIKSLTFSPSIDHSSNSSCSDLAHYPDTPDLGRRNNGIELKAMEAFSDPMDVQFEPSGAIVKEEFAQHVERFDAKRQLLFQEEFEWLTKKSPWHPAEASNDPRNDHKNRYSNITAFDHSSVKLKPIPGVECSDYINANYITGYNKSQEYIATQGPLDQTVEDFWRMIWEQRTTTIIMLTNVVELGKIKCSQYWPVNSKTMYGDIAVTLESTHVFPDYVIRTLSVQSARTNEQRRVLQFHYTKWPDYGTPKLAAPLLNFLKIVHESNDCEDSGPIVVHCSAGVGRSGTVLTIDNCLQQLRHENVVNICSFVRNMREQRNYMVQTDQQYTFIHYAILEAITYGDTSFDVETFKKSYSKLQSASPASSPTKFLLGEEFQRLGVVKTMLKKSSFQNRIKVKGAPQRHYHSSFHGGSTSGSLQQCLGHFLDGYNQAGMFVTTEGPDEMTATRFWEIIWDYNCGYIIMLTPLDAEELFCYWPDSGEAEVQFGSIKVMVENESAEHLYTSRRIRLTNTKVEGISHQVVQYQFMGWTAQYLPRVPDFVSFVCDVLQKVDTSNKKIASKVMVHDTASLGPAGIFCSLFYSIQRLQMEKMVDIFQAVQMIQLQRPGCVSDVGEYAFVYDCVYEFLMKNS